MNVLRWLVPPVMSALLAPTPAGAAGLPAAHVDDFAGKPRVVDGRTYVSDQATIWRWREAFQHELSARMDWTVKPHAEANHNPVVSVNGQGGTGVIEMDVVAGQPVVLDAAGSRDPDGQAVRYRWFHDPEAGFVPASSWPASRSPAPTHRARP